MKPWKKAPLINLSWSTTLDSIKAHRRVLGLHIAQTTKLFFFVSIELEVEKNIRDYKYCEITTAPSRKQLRITQCRGGLLLCIHTQGQAGL